MSANATAVIECPNCKHQLQLNVNASSGPKSSTAPATKGDGVLDLLEEAEGRSNLTVFEVAFVKSTRERWDKYKDRILMTDRQRDTLEKIARGEGRR